MNQLKQNYQVLPIEVDKRDFVYYNDKEMVSIDGNLLAKVINENMNKEAIIIDVNNNASAEAMCQQVLYLVEPSIVKLNKLVMTRPAILNELKNKMVVLNPSMLSERDMDDFEYESKLKVFFNMPPIDDHKRSDVLNELLQKLGFSRQ